MFAVTLLIVMCTDLYAQNKGLVVEVQRIKKIQGELHYQLFSCPDTEETSWTTLIPLVSRKTEIKTDSLKLNFPMLKSGQYIVRAFQDLNGNAELDFSGNGIPKEPTGFSNNPSLLLGYPNPVDSCFLYDEDNRETELVVIKLNNKKQRKRRKVR